MITLDQDVPVQRSLRVSFAMNQRIKETSATNNRSYSQVVQMILAHGLENFDWSNILKPVPVATKTQ